MSVYQIRVSHNQEMRKARIESSRRHNVRVDCCEYGTTIASRLYFSDFYRGVYLLMITSSVVCIIWTMVNHWRIPIANTFLALEVCVTCTLVFEILLRMLAFRQKFWLRWSCILDVAALAFSLTSVALCFLEQGVVEELEEVALDSALALRNCIQYFRLVVFLKNREQMKRNRNVNEIDFEKVCRDDMDEMDASGEDDDAAQSLDAQLDAIVGDQDALEQVHLVVVHES